MTESPNTLWYSRCPGPTASGIAITGGWLDREFIDTPIEVSSLRSIPDRAHRATHFTHDHQALFRQGGIVPPIWARSEGTPIRLLGISEVPRFQGLVALPGSGITEPADLAGKRIGLPRRTAEPVDFWRAQSLRGILSALDSFGLTSESVSVVDLPTAASYHTPTKESTSGNLWTAREASRLQTTEVLALVRGEVDVIYTSAPAGLPLIELLDARIVVDLRTTVNGSSGIGTLAALTVSEPLLQEQPEYVIRYVTALLRAAEWASENVSAAIGVFAAEEGVAEEWAEIGFETNIAKSLKPDLSARLLAGLQQEADFLLAQGFIHAEVDVESWAAPDVLQAAISRLETTGSGRTGHKRAAA